MKISRRKIIELIRESAGEMRSREAIAGAQSMRSDGVSFEDFTTELLDYLEDRTNQQWSEEMLSDDWNYYDEWIEGADPRSIADEYLSDAASYMMENKMKITRKQLRRIIKEEKQKLLNENVPSAIGMEILSIRDALFDIKMGVAYHDDELANDLELQIDRLLRLGYKA